MIPLFLSLYISIANAIINDFRMGIHVCDGPAGANTGAIQYTPWILDGAGWSPWASDSNWYGPDGFNIGLFGRDNTASSSTSINDMDIRFGIQATKQLTDTNGNPVYDGDIQYTEWASNGGGWSDFAIPKTGGSYEFLDGVRIIVEVRDNPGLIINNIRVGIEAGTPQYNDKFTSYLTDGTTTTWSDWSMSGAGAVMNVKIYLDPDFNCKEGTTYTAWSECDAICHIEGGASNQGEQTRTRLGDIAATNNGAPCSDPLETQSCVGNICCPNIESRAVNWDTLITAEENKPNIVVPEFIVNPNDLSLNIRVELDYLGSAFADNQDSPNFGVTYVLDFEDFDAHKDKINEPGTCQNRKDSSFVGISDFSDFWKYSLSPQHNGEIGTVNDLAYGPPGDHWTISMKNNNCNTVVYEGKFTWQNLRDCTDGTSTGDSYTMVTADNNWLNLTGTFYVNLVSPFWYGSTDLGFYRVYQLLSQPFVIAISSTVYVLGSTGINLMTMSIIAVYKQDEESDFRLIVMTETAEYMQLIRDSNNKFEFIKDGNNNNNLATANFDASLIAENSGCLKNKDYLCSQLWQIEARNILCKKDISGTDFSGTYSMTFNVDCKDKTIDPEKSYCLKWLDDHTDIRDNEISLSSQLIWKDDICDPALFTVQLLSEMRFYAKKVESDTIDDIYGDDHKIVTEEYLYQVGEDSIYIEIWTDFPDQTLTIFNTELVNVWICTFAPGIDVPSELGTDGTAQTSTSMGCFNDKRDKKYDGDFYHIFSSTQNIQIAHGFTEHSTETISDIERFSFIVPNEVARDTLYIHVQIEVELQELTRRRRVLLDVNTANKIQHFGDQIGINHGKKKNKSPQQKPYHHYNGPQEPLTNPNISIPSIPSIPSWIIIISCLLGLVLIFNVVFMCYINCYKNTERRSYESIKNNTESEDGDESEVNPINNI